MFVVSEKLEIRNRANLVGVHAVRAVPDPAVVLSSTENDVQLLESDADDG